jgi:ribosomal protein S18 acetylase RimI-like enzyme
VIANNKLILLKRFKRIIERILYDCKGAAWYQLDLGKEIPTIDPQIQVVVNLYDRDETINWLRGRKEPWLNNVNEIEIALRDGDDFVNVKYEKEIIAYSRIGMGSAYIGYFETKLPLPKVVAFLGHIYVVEKHRRKGIGEYLMLKIIQELKSRRFEKLGLHIATWNIPMENLLRGMGFDKIAYIRYVKIFGKIRFWLIKNVETKSYGLKISVPQIYHSNQVKYP